MNVYATEYLAEWEVKEEMFKDRQQRDQLAKTLRKDGWEVTTKKWSFDGDERYTLDARRKRT